MEKTTKNVIDFIKSREMTQILKKSTTFHAKKRHLLKIHHNMSREIKNHKIGLLVLVNV